MKLIYIFAHDITRIFNKSLGRHQFLKKNN